MCEVLFRVVDKTNPDPLIDCKMSKRGDIVVIVPDGWGWTPAELTNPDWRIVKFPNVAQATAEAFAMPEQDADPAHPSRMLRRRAFMFDMTNVGLPAAFRTWIADNARAAPTRTISLTGPQLAAFMVRKAPLADPQVL